MPETLVTPLSDVNEFNYVHKGTSFIPIDLIIEWQNKAIWVDLRKNDKN